jgi:O-antigen/teichoic acid export membrane protein
LRQLAATVARNVGWLAAGEVFLKGGLFVAGVLVARGLGPAAMGSFTVSYGAAVVFMLLLAAGQVEVVIREAARRPDEARGLSRLARAWQARIAVVAVPLAVAGAFLVPERSLRWTLLAFIPYAWLRCGLITAGAAFKGLDRMDVEVGGRGVELAVALAILTPSALLAAPGWTTGLAFSLGGAAGMVFVVGKLRGLHRSEAPSFSQAFMAREGLSFLGLNLAFQLLVRLDTFLLAALGVEQSRIGHYGVAGAPVWGLLGLAQLISLALYPTLARAAGRGELLPGRILALAAGGAALGVALAGALSLVKVPLVRLVFGVQYLDAIPLIAVLAWALPGACSSMVLGAVIGAAGRQSWSLTVQIALVILAGVANLVAIPRWGLPGCAAVVVGAQALGLLSTLAVALLAGARPRRYPDAVLPPELA